jgi:hypothetical protein
VFSVALSTCKKSLKILKGSIMSVKRKAKNYRQYYGQGRGKTTNNDANIHFAMIQFDVNTVI